MCLFSSPILASFHHLLCICMQSAKPTAAKKQIQLDFLGRERFLRDYHQHLLGKLCLGYSLRQGTFIIIKFSLIISQVCGEREQKRSCVGHRRDNGLFFVALKCRPCLQYGMGYSVVTEERYFHVFFETDLPFGSQSLDYSRLTMQLMFDPLHILIIEVKRYSDS